MTLVTNHVVTDTGHTTDHNAIATQVNTNTAAIATLSAASGVSGFASINSQAGTTYTFALADAGTGGNSVLNEFTAASAVTATIPPNAAVAFPVGSVLCVSQGGAGQVTLAAGAGVTLRVPNGAKTAQQWSQIVATQRATNDWIISGDSTV